MSLAEGIVKKLEEKMQINEASVADDFLMAMGELVESFSDEKAIIKDMPNALEKHATSVADMKKEIDTVVSFLNKIKKGIK